MLDQFPIANESLIRFDRPAIAARESEIQVSIRQFFHPYVLAFLALALAVGANGYGYKLSQYLQQTGVSKASPTHMWVDHRDESVVAQANHQSRPEQIPALAFLAVSALLVLRLSRDHVVVTPAPARVAILVSSHIPFRAPPSLHSSLA